MKYHHNNFTAILLLKALEAIFRYGNRFANMIMTLIVSQFRMLCSWY
ncbi:hypothetical protein [Pedobacter frigoris]|nr:hypothetical protein [Pedobacter frigoris]